MSIIRPAPTEPAAAERTGDPGHCHACRRPDTKRRYEQYDNQPLYLCVDYMACNRASGALSR